MGMACRVMPVYSLITFGVGVVIYLAASFRYASADFIVLGIIIMAFAGTLGMAIEMMGRNLRCLRMRLQQLRRELCEKYHIGGCPGN